MQSSDYIAFASVAVTIITAVISGVYAIITNSKKYELAEQYKCEILAWYEKVVLMIMRLTTHYDAGDDIKSKDMELAELSALIEVGRFYFPNIDKKDGFGKDKQLAYCGYRHIALDFLVFIYNICSKNNFADYKKQVMVLEREFTSCVFELIDPNKRKLKLERYTDLTMPAGKTIDDFLIQKQGDIEYFWHN